MMKNEHDDWLTGSMWVLLGIILDFGLQLLVTSSSQGLAILFGQPKEGILATSLMVLITLILTAVVVYLLTYAVRLRSPKLGWHPWRRDKVRLAVLGYPLLLVATMLIKFFQLFFTGGIATADNELNLRQLMAAGPYDFLFVFILAVGVAPLVEELIFRGVVLNYFFKQSQHYWLNIGLSAILFGFSHVFQAFNFFDFLQYATMGAILATVYKRTRQLQYAVLLHAINNTVAMVVSLITINPFGW